MLSLIEAAKFLQKKAITYEYIIAIDNGTNETLQYFERYKESDQFTVIYGQFKNLSASRNNAVHQSKGTYITFLDADDLVSDRWLINGLNTAKRERDAVVHPQYSITFGDDNLIWEKRNSHSQVIDTLCLIDNNLWDSPCLAKREIFVNHPYHPNGNGFGYEDKHFNCQTIADNINHVIAHETLLFVRRKITGSMLRQATSDLVTVAKNQLLSYENIKSLKTENLNLPSVSASYTPLTTKLTRIAKHKSKKLAMTLHNHAKRYEIYNSSVHPLREAHQAKKLTQLKEKYPTWMLEDWRKIHKIDNQIFPSKELIKHLNWYNAENITPGIKYTQLVQSFSKKPDTLFFVPHLIKGGADMLFINYPIELAKLHPEWHIAMLQTESKESVWRHKIPNSIDFINLFEIFQSLDYDTKYRLLATLVTQNDIKRIIIGNSQLAYDFVSHYKTLLTELDIAVYCFAFGEEFDEEGRLWGHIHTGIPKIYPVIYKIITDNQNTVNKLSKEYAFSSDKFRVHYQPTSAKINATTDNNRKPLKVLWASRVCKQKRPDILKSISNMLDPNEYLIDAYGQLEEGMTESYFLDSKVHYKGPFNGSESLPTGSYDVFLYTSEGDGVPNVLQEMTAAGLPIVASSVGGIKEFVMTDKTGFLIEDHEKIEDYVTAIKKLSDRSVRKKLHIGAQMLLEGKFSSENWKDNVKKDFDR